MIADYSLRTPLASLSSSLKRLIKTFLMSFQPSGFGDTPEEIFTAGSLFWTDSTIS